jgi:iron complex outermembrane receptor protein
MDMKDLSPGSLIRMLLLAGTAISLPAVAHAQSAAPASAINASPASPVASPSDGANVPDATAPVTAAVNGAPSASNATNQGLLTQDIVVTANRREQNLQKVGISITAFNGEAMQKLGFVNTTDIVKQTPAVSFYQFSPSVSNINIRGVVQNDFADHLEPPIAVYQDDTYVGSSGGVSVPLFDMQRVEVLRGPQGTLFGRNATGGLIHFISAAPTDHLAGYFQGSYGSFNTYNLQGAISGPITDNVLGRFAFTRNQSDGPFYNTLTGKHDAGDTDNYAFRGQLLFDLGDTKIRLLGRYNRDDQHGPAYSGIAAAPGANGLGVPVGPNQIAQYPNIVTGGTVTAPCPGCNVVGFKASGDPFTVADSYPGYFKRSIYDGQIKITHDFGAMTFTSITDYLKIDKFLSYNDDSSPAQFFVYGTTQRYHQVSEEARLNGTSGKLKWVAGLFYLNMDGRYSSAVDLDLAPYVGAPLCIGTSCPPGGTVPAHFQTNYRLITNSIAGFAQGEYELNSYFSLIGGLRYTHDQKKYDYAFTDTPAIQAPFTYNTSNNPAADRPFNNFSAKAEVDYKPDTTTLIYLSYTRGHKGGNWTAPVFPPIDPSLFAHKQEVLTSYEAGLKKRFLGGRATFNVSGFYYDYHNYQAFSLINIAQTITNVNATVYGGEAELKLTPMDGLDLGLNASTIHSNVKDIVLPDGEHVDRKLPNTPTVTLSGLARYAWNFAGGQMAIQASGQFKSDYYLTVLNEPVNHEKKWATLDLRLSWTAPNDRLELAVYGDNVTSTRYRVWGLDVSSLSLGMQVYAPPASWGASARYKF